MKEFFIDIDELGDFDELSCLDEPEDIVPAKITFDDWLIAVDDRKKRLNGDQLAQFICNTIWTTVAGGKPCRK